MFPPVGIFDSFSSSGQEVFDLTIPSPLLDLSCSYVEFTFCVCRYFLRAYKDRNMY